MCESWITETYINDLRYAANKHYLAIKRVRELHMESGGTCIQCTEAETGGDEQWIEWHSVKYPCPTIKALDGEQ